MQEQRSIVAPSALQPPPWKLLLALAVLVLLTRLPWFFPAVLDWDESTFTIVGQALLDGELPYTSTWDNKPPLAFVFYAAALALFGPSVESVRLAGAIAVFAAAVMIFRIGLGFHGRSTGLVAACVHVGLVGSRALWQSTMTEHVALLPLLGMVLVLGSPRPSSSRAFWAGTMGALATLVRVNLGLAVIAAGIWLPLESRREPWRVVVGRVAAYALGGLLVLSLTAIPYVLTGQLDLFVTSVFVMPMLYADQGTSVIWTTLFQAAGAFGFDGRTWHPLDATAVVVWVPGLIGVVALLRQKGETTLKSIYFAIFLGTGVSLVFGGHAFSHYLIQLAPFFAIGAGWAYASTMAKHGVRLAAVTTLAVTLLSAPTIRQYTVLAEALADGQGVRSGPEYPIAAYLRTQMKPGESVLALTNHLVYWLVDQRPLSRILTHPSNVAREYMVRTVEGNGANSVTILKSIFARAPAYIVTTEFPAYVAGTVLEALLRAELRQNYEKVLEVEGSAVYRRVGDRQR